MYMFGVVGETPVYITFSDMSLFVYNIICVICISKKLKYLKNEARESKTER